MKNFEGGCHSKLTCYIRKNGNTCISLDFEILILFLSSKEIIVVLKWSTFNVAVLVNSTFKKKAPKAIKEIKKFAQKAMGTTDVRVDVKLNKQIWSRGIRSVPRRVRVRIARKRNDDEDAKEELYSLVTVAEIPVEGLKGLGTKIIDDED
uniref:60S ribosomal protein L31-like n=1 Tax=Erigeron canadensis TaxID=72917 RepID=UPI001CB9811D|nr:60S ribosomal protein L31-like [Erigeron canadensis]